MIFSDSVRATEFLPGMIEPSLLKIDEASRYLSVSRVSIRRLIKAGRLKRHPAFRHILIKKSDLDRFIDQG